VVGEGVGYGPDPVAPGAYRAAAAAVVPDLDGRVLGLGLGRLQLLGERLLLPVDAIGFQVESGNSLVGDIERRGQPLEAVIQVGVGRDGDDRCQREQDGGGDPRCAAAAGARARIRRQSEPSISGRRANGSP